MGRSLSIIKWCSAFLTTLSTRQDLKALVLSHLDYSSVVWSGATKKELGKLQLVQNKAALLALGCTQKAIINDMHVNLSWLKVEERLTSSLPVFMRGCWHVECLLSCLTCRAVCLNYWHTARTPMHTPQDMPQEVSTQSPSPEQTMGGAQSHDYMELFHIK